MATKLIIVLVAIGLIIVSAMLCAYLWLPEWITNQLRFSAPDKQIEFLAATRASLAILLSGVVTALTALAAVGTVYATYRSYVSTQDKHLADALSKSTELLGSEQIPMRLGGIYVMRRIARTSEQDYLAVMQILSGYVRDRCGPIEHQPEELATTEVQCPPDVQAILTILGERPWKNSEGNYAIDLSRVHLHGVSLRASNLARAILNDARLFSVDFRTANLSEADLSYCQLSQCRFHKAKLTGATLTGTVFLDATGLTQEQLERARGDRTTILPKNIRYPNSWPGVQE